MLRIEAGLIVLALLTAWAHPALGCAWFDRVERRFSALARRRALAVLVVGAAALLLRLAVLPVEPVPEPIVHDEFSYLLAADTFAHGRLTNPTPPMWEHFETFHVISHPTYASIYPPAQGLVLALGKIVFGHPFWGVWLSCGLMCAAITWMLQGWLSAEWALLGGFLAVLRYGVFGYWADSYWGGAVAAVGGALVLGALPRIKESQRLRDALLMGIGLALLANSRPYEGLVFSLPVAVILIAWLLSKKSPTFKTTVPHVVLPLLLLLALAGAWMGYYFWRVTGSPVRMPYQIERQTYAIAPYFVWQPIRPEPAYHHAVMKKMFVEQEMRALRADRSLIGLPFRAYIAWCFFLGPVFSVPFLMLTLTAPTSLSYRTLSRRTLSLFFVLGVFTAGTLLVNFYSPHYSAPATGLIILLLILAMQQLRNWGASGIFLTRAVVLIALMSVVLRSAATPLHIPLQQFYEFSSDQENWPGFGRAAIEQELRRIPGKHLVFVRYSRDHGPYAEWVYNGADLAAEQIIWARDMGESSDRKLVASFEDRNIWLLDADQPPLVLRHEDAAALDGARTEPHSKKQ